MSSIHESYARSVATVFGELEYRGDQMILHVSEVWKGGLVLIGASISIPRHGPLPEGVKDGTKERTLAFFYLQPSIQSHRMLFFSGDRLRSLRDVSKADLKRTLEEHSTNLNDLLRDLK
jgi:hypothetical protein